MKIGMGKESLDRCGVFDPVIECVIDVLGICQQSRFSLTFFPGEKGLKTGVQIRGGDDDEMGLVVT